MQPRVREELATALGSPVSSAEAMSGGDINDAWRVTLDDGHAVFVKTNERADPAMFPREAEGLVWLAEANALRTPEVLAASDAVLALELIGAGRRAAGFDEQLGRGLAALHRAGAEGFGFSSDNFIGTLPQDNGREADWPRFYVRRRLEPQLRMAVDRGLASATMRRGLARVFSNIDALTGPSELPSRLHGDLWRGNCFVDQNGAPVLIDPAVYGGHREMDLAMMQLFGGFDARVFSAYDEAYPLAPGWRERVPLYQLYPLLVHVNLFGDGYVTSVERALDALP